MRNSDFDILNKAIMNVDRRVDNALVKDMRLAVSIDELRAEIAELREDLNLLAQHNKVRFDEEPPRNARRVLVYLDGVDVDG